MQFVILFLSLVAGWMLVFLLYPLGGATVFMTVSRQLTSSYNCLKRRHRQRLIQQAGRAVLQRIVEQAPIIARRGAITTEEVLEVLNKHKAELIDRYGTQAVQRSRPDLFQELESKYENWL
jgi:ATP-dependent RNA circularization protein (DNA/RNA ligase family)